MRPDIHIDHFKQKLETELKALEQELSSVGGKNPVNLQDWETTPAVMDILAADKNEVADNLEELEDRSAILNELEIRYNSIKVALDKINKGNYGICEGGGEPIPEKRLEAFPDARTCIEHAENVN